MYVQFPPDSQTTRVDDDTIRELTATDDEPDGHAVERDSPDDDSAIQVTAELGEHLIEQWGFVEHSETTDTAETNDEITVSSGGA